MLKIFSFIAKLLTYGFWLSIDAMFSLVPDEVDMMAQGPAEQVNELGREETWSSWATLAYERPLETGK